MVIAKSAQINCVPVDCPLINLGALGYRGACDTIGRLLILLDLLIRTRSISDGSPSEIFCT
jgi:hypothetical protein